jgi:thiol-disulfide isomerase/thioredoxin
MRMTFLALASLLVASCGQEPAREAAREAPTAAASKPSGGATLDRARKGQAAPEVAFMDPDGEAATLSEMRGKPVLLNLWATWCAPCVAEMPTLNALAKREGDALQVVTLSEDLEGQAKAEGFLKEKKLSHLEAWFDPDMKLMGALGVTNLPTTILYDAEGRELWRVTGDEDWTSDKAAKLIAEVR